MPSFEPNSPPRAHDHAIPAMASDAAVTARSLYCAMRALIRQGEGTAAASHRLLEPLAKTVLTHRSRVGQALCARFAAELAAGNHDRALAVCEALMDLDRQG